TIMYSEAAGRSQQCFTGKKCVAYDATSITGPIWADSDNRITVTGTSADGTTSFASGPCVMNCNNLQVDIYSFHTAGANVCLADVEVRSVKEGGGIPVLTGLVQKPAGEVIDPNSY